MTALHEEVVVADDGLATVVGGTVDDYILADDVVVADDAFRLLATEAEVLGQGGDDGSLVNLVVSAHSCSVKDADEGEDDAVVANHHVVFDIYEGEYLAIVADSGLWADFGFRTDFACHNF